MQLLWEIAGSGKSIVIIAPPSSPPLSKELDEYYKEQLVLLQKCMKEIEEDVTKNPEDVRKNPEDVFNALNVPEVFKKAFRDAQALSSDNPFFNPKVHFEDVTDYIPISSLDDHLKPFCKQSTSGIPVSKGEKEAILRKY